MCTHLFRPRLASFQCIQVSSSSNSSTPLYAKVGCMNRETYTATKLQLHVYTDAQCSQRYNDGHTARDHAVRGYVIGDKVLSSKVSFRPPFYSCITCAPDFVAGTFNKKAGNWYDDDYINYSSRQQNGNNGGNNNNNKANGDDAAVNDDLHDDKYRTANDDVAYDDANGGGRQLEEAPWQEQLKVRAQCSSILHVSLLGNVQWA
jgi:hypothetical protein